MTIIIDTPEGIAYVQLVARRGALRMEMAGMKKRGRSAYSICKEVYGLKGSREKVLIALDKMIQEANAKMTQPDAKPLGDKMMCGACARIGTNDIRPLAHAPGCPNDN